MKDVLILLSPTPDGLSAGAHYALALARAHGAHLSALIAEIETDPSNFPPAPDLMQANETTSRPPTSVERLVRTAEAVRSAANRANVPCEVLETGGATISLREQMIGCAQVRDVLVIDVCGPLQYPRRDLVDGALLGSGRPVVLVPPRSSPFAEESITVAWDATRSAVRAVHDALPLLIRARDVNIVSVVDDKTFPSPYSGQALCSYLARWKVNANFKAINRKNLNVGMALLAHAQQANANLLVMGGFAHGVERALMLGSATRDVFQTSLEIPVFLSH